MFVCFSPSGFGRGLAVVKYGTQEIKSCTSVVARVYPRPVLPVAATKSLHTAYNSDGGGGGGGDGGVPTSLVP